MTTALVSLLTGRQVKPNVGMTGEVTLQGKVLPIGGVKQKVLAAHRAGLTEVILPKRNGPDLEDVPERVPRGHDVPPGRHRRRRPRARPRLTHPLAGRPLGDFAVTGAAKSPIGHGLPGVGRVRGHG